MPPRGGIELIRGPNDEPARVAWAAPQPTVNNSATRGRGYAHPLRGCVHRFPLPHTGIETSVGRPHRSSISLSASSVFFV